MTNPLLQDLGAKFEAGVKTRRAVLGDAYVDGALENVSAFALPLQKLVSEYCWDEVWNRPGLARRERSILNIGMLAAMGRNHELKTHFRGALNNGLSAEELRELVLQIAIYCGVPVALDSFRVLEALLAEMAE